MTVDPNCEAIQAFIAQCDEMKNSQLIMSSNKIRLILKCLAYYDELRTVVDQCKYNFDFEREYSKAIVNLGTTNIFKLPLSNCKKVALVVCLLLDFDAPRRDFVRFVMEFYPSSDRAESYRGFCNGIIEPFKKAVVELLTITTQEQVIRDNMRQKDTKLIEVNKMLSEQAGYLIDNASSAVKAAAMDDDVRNEILFMVEGFATVLEMKDAQIIRGYWIGLRNTLSYYRLATKVIGQMNELLKAYLVI